MTESEKQTIAALSTLASGLAGGLIGNSTETATAAAKAGKTTVENNYLDSSENSLQTYLNHKKDLTPQERQKRDDLNRKDLETDQALMNACHGKGGDCSAERAKAKEALETYINLSYLNPKEAQAGHQQIQALLSSTDPNAKDVFNVPEGYTQAFMRFGYTEDEAQARAGIYVGTVYTAGGISSVIASGELAKQFGEDVAAGTKPGISKVTSKKGSKNTQPEKNLPSESNVEEGKACKGDYSETQKSVGTIEQP
nr:VENN motif pre-toxin domain-containing protein [Enterobacter sp. Bisph1]